MSKSNRYSPEVRERAVRMVHEHRVGLQCAAASGVGDEGMAPRHRLAGAGGKPP